MFSRWRLMKLTARTKPCQVQHSDCVLYTSQQRGMSIQRSGGGPDDEKGAADKGGKVSAAKDDSNSSNSNPADSNCSKMVRTPPQTSSSSSSSSRSFGSSTFQAYTSAVKTLRSTFLPTTLNEWVDHVKAQTTTFSGRSLLSNDCSSSFKSETVSTLPQTEQSHKTFAAMGSSSSKQNSNPNSGDTSPKNGGDHQSMKESVLLSIPLPMDLSGLLHVSSALDASNLDKFLNLFPAADQRMYRELNKKLGANENVQTIFWAVGDSEQQEAAVAVVVSRLSAEQLASSSKKKTKQTLPSVDDYHGSVIVDSPKPKKMGKVVKKMRIAGYSVDKVVLRATDVEMLWASVAKAGDYQSACVVAMNSLDRGRNFRSKMQFGLTYGVNGADPNFSVAGLKVGCYSVFTRGVMCLEQCVVNGEILTALPPLSAEPTNDLTDGAHQGGCPFRPAEESSAKKTQNETRLGHLMNLGLMLCVMELCREQPTSGGLAVVPGRSSLITEKNTPPALMPLVSLLRSVIFKLQYNYKTKEAMDALRTAIIANSPLASPSTAQKTPDQNIDDVAVVNDIAEVVTAICKLPFAGSILNATRKAIEASTVIDGSTTMDAATMHPITFLANDGFYIGQMWMLVDPSTQNMRDVAARAAVIYNGTDARLDPAVFRAYNCFGAPIRELSQLHPFESVAVNFTGDSSYVRVPVSLCSTIPSSIGDDIHEGGEEEEAEPTTGFSSSLSTEAKKPGAGGALIPTVPGAPLVGNVSDLQELGVHGAMNKWITSHGDIVRVDLLGNPTYCVRRASFAVAVLAAQNKLPPPTNIGGGHDGIFFADGETHTMLRGTFNEKFYDNELRKMFPRIVHMADRFVHVLHRRCIEQKQDMRMWDWSVKLYYDMMADVGLGCPAKAFALGRPADEAPEILEIFNEILDMEKGRQIAVGAGLDVLNSLPTASNRRYDKKVKRIYDLAQSFVDEYEQTKSLDPNKTPCFLDACDKFSSLPPERRTKLGRAQILNFLRAGSDTTAATLTWTTMLLSLHPHVEERLIDELDSVFSDDSVIPTVDNIQKNKLPFLDAVIKESMRLHPPANVLLRGLTEDLELTTPQGAVGYDGNKYKIPKGARILVDIVGLHKDVRYYRNPNVFDPDRFADPDRYRAMESGQYIPFGGGPRTCIGNIFGFQEVKVTLIQLYRKYRFKHCGDPIRVREGDDQKPISGDRLAMELRGPRKPRAAVAPLNPDDVGMGDPSPTADAFSPSLATTGSAQEEADAEVFVLYGSNQGMCETLADKLTKLCAEVLKIRTVKTMPLDSVNLDDLFVSSRTPRIALVCCATYNGAPPNNAVKFVKAIAQHFGGANSDRGSYLQFAVLGAGNSNWGATYQAVPSVIDRHLGRCGALRLVPFTVADSCDGPSCAEEAASAWQVMLKQVLVDSLKIRLPQRAPSPQATPSNQIDTTPPPSTDEDKVGSLPVDRTDGLCIFTAESIVEAAALSEKMIAEDTLGVMAGQMEQLRSNSTIMYSGHADGDAGHDGVKNCSTFAIKENIVISGPAALREVRHIELIATPKEGESCAPYSAGDHLEVRVDQHPETVEKLLKVFGFTPSTQLFVHFLPNSATLSGLEHRTGHWVPAVDVIKTRDIRLTPTLCKKLGKYVTDPKEAALLQLSHEHPAVYESCFTAKGIWTLVDLLTEVPSLHLTVSKFLSVTAPIAHRFYSISSRSSDTGDALSVTVGIVDDERNGYLDNYHGLASYKLGHLTPIGQSVSASVVTSTFRLPSPAASPSEQFPLVVLIAGGTGIAPMMGFLHELHHRNITGRCLVYFGCRNEDEFLYREQLQGDLKDVASLRVAMSRQPGMKKQYVQDLLNEDHDKLYAAFKNDNAHFYVCGGAKTVGVGARSALVSMFSQHEGLLAMDAEARVSDMMSDGRFQLDVWGV